jgi:enoyl-CoA hydratase/carnithine racemase
MTGAHVPLKAEGVYGTGLKLPRIVGHAHALDPLMSARRVQSDEALRIGLVNRLYPPEQPREQTFRAIFAKAWRSGHHGLRGNERRWNLRLLRPVFALRATTRQPSLASQR